MNETKLMSRGSPLRGQACQNWPTRLFPEDTFPQRRLGIEEVVLFLRLAPTASGHWHRRRRRRRRRLSLQRCLVSYGPVTVMRGAGGTGCDWQCILGDVDYSPILSSLHLWSQEAVRITSQKRNS